MNLKRSILSISLFFLTSALSPLAAEEKITISSYYPSPAGVYKSLRLYPRNDASFAPDKPCRINGKEGEMVYYKDSIDFNKDSVVVCGDVGNWKKIEDLGNASFWALGDSDTEEYLYPKDSKSSVAIGTDTVSFGTYMARQPLEQILQKAKLQVEGAISRQGTQLLGNSAAQASQINLGVNIGLDNSITGRPEIGVDIWGATVSGGGANIASGNYATVSGGVRNLAGNNFPNPVTNFATVSGGLANIANGQAAVVSGGESNQASGAFSVVSGGRSNLASGLAAVVSGGQSNQAINNYAVVSGGASNTASGIFSAVSGGVDNIASGDYASVSGGQSNRAAGDYSWAGGRNMQLGSTAHRTFAWGHSAIPRIIPEADAFIIYSDAATFIAQIGNPTPPLPSPSNRTNLFIYNLPQGSGDNLLYDRSTGQISRPVSSIRYKTNIRPIEKALAKVQQLRGVYFNWKEGGKPALGMIAEEVGAVFPEVVSYEANGQDAQSLAYDKLVALLVEAIKEQEQEITDLEQRKRALEKRAER